MAAQSFLPVYGVGASRPKGTTTYPCAAISRIGIAYNEPLNRPYLEVFEASETQYTYTIPEMWGGGAITGPAQWTWKPFPTPIVLTYQIDLLATVSDHIPSLLPFVFEVLPTPSRPTVNGQKILIASQGNPMVLDDLEPPEFRLAIRLEVRDLWIDRVSAWTKPGIRDLSAEFGDYGG